MVCVICQAAGPLSAFSILLWLVQSVSHLTIHLVNHYLRLNSDILETLPIRRPIPKGDSSLPPWFPH